jgi:hypothetical protein
VTADEAFTARQRELFTERGLLTRRLEAVDRELDALELTIATARKLDAKEAPKP